ncbi:hypothetical protein JHK84_029514 [Glycine max]|nr:hypothetical protein JHK84_029514 [Glycine max]
MGQSRDKEREQGRGSGSDGVVSGGAGEEYIPEKVDHPNLIFIPSNMLCSFCWHVGDLCAGRAVVARQWLGPGWGSCIKQIQAFSWEEK